MNIDQFTVIRKSIPEDGRYETLRREKTATDFEELFARHLVREMTNNTFKMNDDHTGVGQTGSLYREFITDALAGQLAAQRKLGVADMVMKYQERFPVNEQTVQGDDAGTTNDNPAWKRYPEKSIEQ